MLAITIPEPGAADALVLTEVPVADPGPGEVRIAVVAAGINRADVLQRQGLYPPPPGESDIPGLEVSGHIDAIGAGVSTWQVGDAVCALLAGGGYSELVVVPAGQVLPVPAGVSVGDAAALPEVACTVWSNLVLVAGLRAGEWLLVHGGSSGIGTMAIQVARALGVHVAVTAGLAAKLDECRALGAQVLINYREEDFVVRLAEATSGHGADVILDNMGAKYLSRNVSALATNGRLVVIGMQGGIKGELDLSVLLRKRGAVHATSLRARPSDEKAAVVAAVREYVWPWVEAGTVRPIIDSHYPLAQAPAAHRALEASGHIGKILLTVS